MLQAPRVLIAPSGFKESLSATDAARMIANGVSAACPEATTVEFPLVDGGEGFTEALVQSTGGELHPVRVTGPVGDPVDAQVGILGGPGPRTGVLEMASAAGLRLVPPDRRDPLLTTTYGIGELISRLLDLEVERLLIGCGDSGTNDGGAGMAQALGVGLFKRDGSPLERGGRGLADLDRIDLGGRDPRLDGIRIDVACNEHNLLCGANGVARVFGPQKGASPEVVVQLEAALERYAAVIERDLGMDLREAPGGGASGGLGAGLEALLGATLHPRFEIIMRYLDFDAALDGMDLLITAEGGIDFQTPRGKVPSEVARRAKRVGVPVIAIAGTVGKGAADNYAEGIDAYLSIVPAPCTLAEAVANAEAWLTTTAENVMRMVMAGARLGDGDERGSSNG